MTFQVKTRARSDAVDVTGSVRDAVRASGVQSGICVVYVPHTTAGITINEGADPNVMKDILDTLERLVPWQGGYRHMEGNAAAHVKTSIIGSSVQVVVERGELVLGTWQRIFLCEFDGPRTRRVLVKVLGEK
ncbi:secondary thiamine-phosphate synthase enzyme YjbQ [Thermodesulforhabdus norvegica]|uniref:Secondary thiamine-phosphate synthase enzyme n=1 Tax=Thermodesulforhabdus norvegica TaxID=39841 RepID=A0A1I4QVY9_9BACT|nr:secondary thiamine-phosphate synthase enzyme YjbQ [Thermodesulforhabdus norvegica]SFM43866.1 secondary thiamine-phosphate synthase enzyme [Thermodesulforhabdus norvegica]